MDFNTSPRKTDLIRKSQDMTTTIAELSKATSELKKIESFYKQSLPTTLDEVENNDNNKSYHHQWILDQSTILTVDQLDISSSSTTSSSSSSSSSPPPPPPRKTIALNDIQYESPLQQSTEILNNDLSILPGMTTQSITIAINMLSSKLENIKHLENKLRIDYDERRYNLQESWEKVSTLRNSHITPLRCLIEEVIIEDITEKLEKGSNSNTNDDVINNISSPNTNNIPIKSVSIADLQIIREKIRVKERLVEQVAIAEMSLNDLRKQLSIKTDSLSKGPIDTTSTTSTMESRQQLLAIFKELEIFEKKYVSITVELEIVENELAQALTKAMAITDISLDGRLQEEKQVFNLYEVLSGQAVVTRLKGEKAGDFLLRLQSRLETLLVLDNQMQIELENKTESVQVGKEKLKEIEAERFKVESNLKTEEARLEYLIKQKNVSQPNSNKKDIEDISQIESPPKVNRYKSPEK
jgi:hypothetical protein